MKWVWFTALSALFAMAFFACSNPIESKLEEDELALAAYGPLSEDGMKALVKGAMADCQEDPVCLAAMEKADGNYLPVEEESSSSVAADTTSGEEGSSSSKKGPIIASSGSVKPNLSSSGGSGDSTTGSSSSIASSGSKIVSSSSKGSSILNGACNATPTSVERGGSVTWKYVSLNSSLVIESYEWTFDEGSSISTSTDATPSVSYAAKGEYGASVTINKGKDTEKTVKCSSPVKATGIKVTGCTCSTPTSSVVVSSSKPKDVTWTVSGCTGAEPFTYAWSGGASGTEASASMTISSVGSHAPTVTVTNSDGETMSPTCNSVSASEMPGAACKVGEHNYDANKTSMSVVPEQTFYFKPDNVTGVTGTMSMTLAGGGTSKTISVTNGTNNSATAVTAPAELGTYPYTLSVDGEEVCSADITVAYPTISANCSFASSAIPGGSSKLNVGNLSGWTDAMGTNVSMTLSGGGSSQSITVNRYSNQGWSITAPTQLGTHEYTLTYGGNQVCKASMTVDYPKPSCTIGLNTNSMGSSVSAMPGKTVVFRPGNSSFTGSISMTLTFNGESQSITVKPDNNATTSLTVPDEVGSYPVTLSYEGNQVCSATLKSEYPAITSTSCALKNSNKSFTPGASFSNWDANVIGQTLSMTLYLDDEEVGTASANRYYNADGWMSVTPPTESGTHVFRLDFHGNTVCEVEYEVD